MCVCRGTKSLNLRVEGQLGGEVPVLGFPHIRWGKRKPELEGLGRDGCTGALVTGSWLKGLSGLGRGLLRQEVGRLGGRRQERLRRVTGRGRNRSGNPLGQGLLSGSHSCSHLPLSLSLLLPLPLPTSMYHSPDTSEGRKCPLFSGDSLGSLDTSPPCPPPLPEFRHNTCL